MYRKAKRDANEEKIVRYLRRLRCRVYFLDDPGIPDLLVSTPWTRGDKNLLLEVKGEKGKLTEAQRNFFDTWLGQVDVVRTIKDVKEVIRREMPIYVYQCPICGRFEKRQRFKDKPLEKCPTCGEEVLRVIQAVSIQFNGKGFYSTDNGK